MRHQRFVLLALVLLIPTSAAHSAIIRVPLDGLVGLYDEVTRKRSSAFDVSDQIRDVTSIRLRISGSYGLTTVERTFIRENEIVIEQAYPFLKTSALQPPETMKWFTAMIPTDANLFTPPEERTPGDFLVDREVVVEYQGQQFQPFTTKATILFWSSEPFLLPSTLIRNQEIVIARVAVDSAELLIEGTLVPEPGGMGLWAISIVALVRRRRAIQ